ncbi:MAG: 50S ribosomal protein L3 [Actinobacteria bacterium]|nr:50S ribosomal protein L3 [Actinomycetota bacterium]MCL6092831.1 50S ribosomal protein L3 [Actinomycetota bacterium]
MVGEAAEKPARKTRAKVKKAAGEAEKEVKETAAAEAEAGAEEAAAEAEGGEAAEAAAEETEAGQAPAAEAEAAPEPPVQRDIPSAGDRITVEAFAVGEKVKVSGVSKGKGFAGVIKRHGFAGGPASHGAHFHRAPGSVGASAYPSHVFKGLRLPGHMGNRQATQPGLVVVATEPEQDLLMVKGAVPGSSNAIIFIQTQ